MKYLFAHQNFPAQFRHVARYLAADDNNEVVFITHRDKPEIPGVRKVEYEPHRKPAKDIHPYLRSYESAVIYGQGAARKALELKKAGFRPDLICANPAWGEALFLKDVFPDVPLLSYCEFYYNATGSDVGFDPEYPADFDTRCRVRARSAQHLLSIELADAGYSPTQWQKSQFPDAYLDKISVIHDGIDTQAACPNAACELRLGSGPALRAGDEIVTYVARNLEPYRGFHYFMRALPALLEARPDCRVVIVGGDEVSYGRRPDAGKTYRQMLLDEVAPDPARVHFLGRIPYTQYLQVLQVSAVHVYLTYPFVLSWSMLEAMASECLVVGSDTAPVREVIEDGRNGLLVDFFSPEHIARRTAEALEKREDMAGIRQNARRTILDKYALDDCRTRLLRLMRELTG